MEVCVYKLTVFVFDICAAFGLAAINTYEVRISVTHRSTFGLAAYGTGHRLRTSSISPRVLADSRDSFENCLTYCTEMCAFCLAGSFYFSGIGIKVIALVLVAVE